MNLHRLPLLALLPLTAAAGLAAQECPRPRTQLSSGAVTTSVFGFTGWQIAAPKQSLPGELATGLEPTARVVYAIWPDANANGDVVLRFLRSIDGGWSWDTSRAVDIWTANTAAGETFDTQNLKLLAHEHEVFVVLTADRDPSGNPDPEMNDSCWVLGSADQGQGWQAINVSPALYTPLPNGVDFNDIDEPWGAIGGNGRLHVSFEADYDDTGAGATSGNEDLYYQAVEFDAAGNLVAVFPNERQVNTSAPGTTDIDAPSCAADGNIAVFVWHDPRVNGGDTDDTFSRTTTDGGATFGLEHNHTNFTADESEDVSYGLVHGSTILVVQEDGRQGSPDRIWGSLSFDGGATWTDDLPISKGPSTVDVDSYSVCVSTNGTFVVAYTDDREGTGNVDNDTYVVVDTNGGMDFLNGTHVETQLTTGADNDTTYTCDAYGDVIAVVAETSNFPEDASVFWSTDNGATWQGCGVATGMAQDVDDIYVAVTVNRDIQVIWQDDANLGNDFNKVYTRGLKVGRLEDRTTTGEGIVYVDGSPEDVGDGVVLFASLTPPQSSATNPTPFGTPTLDGIRYNYVLDALSGAVMENLIAFYAVIDANGEARFPLLPAIDWTTKLGSPVHFLGVTFESNGAGEFNRAFTDPLEQR